ncbi:MAG TPA: hypothetical protein VG815_04470 [Chloroflexota bacterium]|nr:hypothetical protein [Chloroflexota bacterium]
MLAVLALSVLVPLVGVPFRGTAQASSTVIYTSIPSPLPDNLPSLGFQSAHTSEFGNQVNFGGSDRVLDTVTVTLSSQACQTGGGSTCVTTPGATFSEPVTFNIYNPPTTGPGGTYPAPGSMIATQTTTFNIPYRPSADPACGNNGWGASCSPGVATNITLDFTSLAVTLPDSVVYGIVYNTQTFGPNPYEVGGPYDSLNVALSQDPTDLTTGSDPNPGTVFWNTNIMDNTGYCDSGAAGTGFFRLDSPGAGNNCWGVNPPYTNAPYYIPAVQFNAAGPTAAIITSFSARRSVNGTCFRWGIARHGDVAGFNLLADNRRLNHRVIAERANRFQYTFASNNRVHGRVLLQSVLRNGSSVESGPYVVK